MKTNQEFMIHGQGTFIFYNNNNSNSNNKNKCCFIIADKDSINELHVSFMEGKIHVFDTKGDTFTDPNNSIGLLEKKGIYYWFSLDAQNRRLYAGYGEARFETKVYEYTFTEGNEEIDKTFLESLKIIKIEEDSVIPIRMLRDPVTRPTPMYVLGTDEITMSDIANDKIMPSACLPPIGRQLYNCVSGKKFILDDSDFPNFSKAIEYSIKTPGLWCYEKLQSKASEFNPDRPNILETYLRITLSENNGESPGIPYVMEIWPVGHYSPVHNHSSANAVIRVLHGSINVSLFPFLCGDIPRFGNVDFKKDDITWISSNLNQTHQLLNLPTNKKTCVTIQCYMYDSRDKDHYDYFDYLDDAGTTQHYEPDSDMDFLAFKEIMKNEWKSRVKRCYF